MFGGCSWNWRPVTVTSHEGHGVYNHQWLACHLTAYLVNIEVTRDEELPWQTVGNAERISMSRLYHAHIIMIGMWMLAHARLNLIHANKRGY